MSYSRAEAETDKTALELWGSTPMHCPTCGRWWGDHPKGAWAQLFPNGRQQRYCTIHMPRSERRDYMRFLKTRGKYDEFVMMHGRLT
jgi:hypothetical protein